MKAGSGQIELDTIDYHILGLLQANCRLPWGKIGEEVGLSAPAVIERVKKLEESRVITGYRAIVDARALGMDITAFIGVITEHPASIGAVEAQVDALPDILECHHVTGTYTLLLKVKTRNTATLEELIRRIRSIEGVSRTETQVVLSTHAERVQLPLRELAERAALPRPRKSGEREDGERRRA